MKYVVLLLLTACSTPVHKYTPEEIAEGNRIHQEEMVELMKKAGGISPDSKFREQMGYAHHHEAE